MRVHENATAKSSGTSSTQPVRRLAPIKRSQQLDRDADLPQEGLPRPEEGVVRGQLEARLPERVDALVRAFDEEEGVVEDAVRARALRGVGRERVDGIEEVEGEH